MHYSTLEQTTAADLAIKTGLYQNEQTKNMLTPKQAKTCLYQQKLFLNCLPMESKVTILPGKIVLIVKREKITSLKGGIYR